MMSPRSGASANSRSSSLSEEQPTAAVATPSASSVLVETPKRIVARYSFECPLTQVSSFVALPMPITRTPVAIGSRVPPCPTLRVWASRRTRETTSWLVSPCGLSITTRPGRGLSGRRAMRVRPNPSRRRPLRHRDGRGRRRRRRWHRQRRPRWPRPSPWPSPAHPRAQRRFRAAHRE